MAFYGNEEPWSAPVRQSSWEQHVPLSRTATESGMSHTGSEANAFASQFEEIERATDNLMRSGKWFPGQAKPSMGAGTARRDSGPTMGGRGYEYNADPRMGGGASRHQSMSEHDGGRPGSAGLQGFYQGQRYPGGRQSEAEQMLQSKRRMAAQRERELRNYHQEQQYNRTVSSAKPDRSMSPTTMSEDDRRELIARQHRALYGDNSTLYGSEGSSSRPQSQDMRTPTTGRGNSPLAFDPFGMQPGGDGIVQMPPRDRPDSTASPASNAPAQQPYNLLSENQQSRRTSNSSPGASPPLNQTQKAGTPGVAPIGTRPAQAPMSAGGLNKRSTTPLTPSSLSHGFNADSHSSSAAASAGAKEERSTSAASNPTITDKAVSGLGGWGSNSGAWGSGKNTLAVQPSVWG